MWAIRSGSTSWHAATPRHGAARLLYWRTPTAALVFARARETKCFDAGSCGISALRVPNIRRVHPASLSRTRSFRQVRSSTCVRRLTPRWLRAHAIAPHRSTCGATKLRSALSHPGFGNRVVCGVGRGNSVGRASTRDRCPWPLRPGLRARSEAPGTPLVAVQADRGAPPRLGGRRSNRRDTPAPVVAQNVLCLSCAGQAITVKPGLVSPGWRSSPASGRHCQRRGGLRGSRHGRRPVEGNHEQAGMAKRVNGSAWSSRDSHRSARGRRRACPTLAPMPRRGVSAISASISRSSR
jgi:hypothetical protein